MIDPLIIMLALLAGVAVRKLGYPPMLGYLIAGFILHALPLEPGALLADVADAGVTLLLFTIGLKLNIRQLAAPQVWAVASIHMLTSVLLVAAILFLAMALWGGESAPDGGSIWIIAFALSFSSTVFAVKIFEERGEMIALHARIAIGILIIQDLAAVVFLGINAGKVPDLSPLLAGVMLALIFSRPLLSRLLQWCGHGELLLLFGILAAFGGAALFESFNIKGDLGALCLGALLAGSKKSSELAEALLDLKDLFLVGFFVTIGLNGEPNGKVLLAALGLALLVFLKPALYFLLMTALRLRARTALLASLALFNYSEFGLIVASLAASAGMLDSDWLVTIALALAISFFISVPFNAEAHNIYHRFCKRLRRFERDPRLPEETHADLGDATIVILGMGRVGVGAYEYLRGAFGDTVIGVDESSEKLALVQEMGIRAVAGDASDEDFWNQQNLGNIKLIMISLTKHSENKAVCEMLKNLGYRGHLAAIARHPDQRMELKKMGCIAFNLYQEAGFGFAEHVHQRIAGKTEEEFSVSHFT